MGDKPKITLDMYDEEGINYRQTLETHTEQEGETYFYHIYRAHVAVENDGEIVPYVFVSYIKNQVEDHNVIPDDLIPKKEINGSQVPMFWVATLDHKPTEEEWDTYF